VIDQFAYYLTFLCVMSLREINPQLQLRVVNKTLFFLQFLTKKLLFMFLDITFNIIIKTSFYL